MPTNEALYWDPPSIGSYFHLAVSAASMEVQRNVLLHFVHQHGLDDRALAYLEQVLPDETYGEDAATED